jgi:hypothetical protein
MKKLLFLSVLVFASTFGFAKKVKFSVDMSTYTISPFGIHVMGDFQAVAGYTLGDWQSNTTIMTKQGSSTIYSVIVDIPAFTKYEFKFVNGDQGYEAEFVPYESRVEPFGFNDNRWIYVDSLANDTTDAGAVIFAANAPAGLSLVRYMVDMSNAGLISPNGVHVAGTFQGWSPTKTILYSFGTNVYEIITYVTNGSYEFKYYNGNTLGTTETVPSGCAVNNNRGLTVIKDTILPTVCFASCSACTASGLSEYTALSGIKMYPNPANSYCTLELKESNVYEVVLNDYTGRRVREYSVNGTKLEISRDDLAPGIYFVSVSDKSNNSSTLKLVIE